MSAPPLPTDADRLDQLQKRIDELEKHSHPPIDLTPAIINILAYLGYPPRGDDRK